MSTVSLTKLPSVLVLGINTLPFAWMRNLSTPSVVTLKCPSEPVSTTSASLFPSDILSFATAGSIEPLKVP